MRRVENLDVLALGYYDGPLRRAVLAIKRGRRDILASLAGRLGKLVVPNELLVGVPTTQIRRYRRGFDGGVLLASRVAMHASTRSVELLRSLQNGAQQGRTGLQRRASVGRFSVRMKENTPSTVTLIDDVCTTGTTLYDCATALARVDILVTRALTLAMVA